MALADVLQVLAGASGKALDAYYNASLVQEQLKDRKKERKAGDDRWMKQFLAAERRHEATLKAQADRDTANRAERATSEANRRGERARDADRRLKTRHLDADAKALNKGREPKGFDDRYDEWLQGQYEPATQREAEAFESQFSSAQQKAKGKGPTEPNYVQESFEQFGDVTKQRLNIARQQKSTVGDFNQPIPGAEPMTDPFLELDSPVKAFNMFLKSQALQDPRFADDPQRAIDSIRAELGGNMADFEPAAGDDPAFNQPASVHDMLPSHQVGGPQGGPAAVGAEGAQGIDTLPEPIVDELEMLLLKYNANPDKMTPEEIARINELLGVR